MPALAGSSLSAKKAQLLGAFTYTSITYAGLGPSISLPFVQVKGRNILVLTLRLLEIAFYLAIPMTLGD